MAVKNINIGQLANDGTGDDIRTAFDKVNDNFVDLDTRFPTAATGTNLGSSGEGVFESATNSALSFKKLIGGNNVTLTSNATSITVSALNSLDQLIVVSDSGTITVDRGQTMSVQGSNGISTSVIGQNLYVSAGNGVLEADGAPKLSTGLNANFQNITNGGSITATAFNGPLEGLVYGIDVRNLAESAGDNAFDFGNFRPVYVNLLDFLARETDVDFGKFVNPGVSNVTVELGTLPSV
tara:strand:+ start:2680 stop:3393 length:714 start_codon:yes stop_codon:yes gene_type:complete